MTPADHRSGPATPPSLVPPRRRGRPPAPAPLPGGTGLRPARLSDLPAVHAIHFDPLVLPGLHQPAMSLSRFRALYARRLTLGHVHVYEHEGRVVGFSMASRGEGLAAHVARLDGFAVVPAVQGTGLARAMLEAVLEALHGEGVRRVEVVTGARDACALRFLARLGFASEGTLHGYLSSDTLPPFADACLLARALPTPPPLS